MPAASSGPARWDRLNRQVVGCERCPRLRAHCAKIATEKRKAFREWEYWGRPVPNFGPAGARLLIVGLAPAAHGANRTGRMFTGDRSGEWLYRALHRAGFATQAESESRDDGLELIDCTITAVCHCAPPDNKPTREEIANCREWFEKTCDLAAGQVLLALGGIAFKAVVAEARRRQWLTGRTPKFAHGACFELTAGRHLLASYHPSQQNTFTGRLTEPMFDEVFAQANQLLGRRAKKARGK